MPYAPTFRIITVGVDRPTTTPQREKNEESRPAHQLAVVSFTVTRVSERSADTPISAGSVTGSSVPVRISVVRQSAEGEVVVQFHEPTAPEMVNAGAAAAGVADATSPTNPTAVAARTATKRAKHLVVRCKVSPPRAMQPSPKAVIFDYIETPIR